MGLAPAAASPKGWTTSPSRLKKFMSNNGCDSPFGLWLRGLSGHDGLTCKQDKRTVANGTGNVPPIFPGKCIAVAAELPDE